jgi:hypothetical protein
MRVVTPRDRLARATDERGNDGMETAELDKIFSELASELTQFLCDWGRWEVGERDLHNTLRSVTISRRPRSGRGTKGQGRALLRRRSPRLRATSRLLAAHSSSLGWRSHSSHGRGPTCPGSQFETTMKDGRVTSGGRACHSSSFGAATRSLGSGPDLRPSSWRNANSVRLRPAQSGLRVRPER